MSGWEVVGRQERDSVNKIFEDNHGIAFAHGFDALRTLRVVRELEKAVAERMCVAHCQAVSSGSAGLYVALKAIGAGPGKEVVTSCFTFIATIEAILMTGATPVCVNIDSTYNIDPIEVEKAITENTVAILPVHMAGSVTDMRAIMGIAERYDLLVIEDACQAMGARYHTMYSGTIGHIGVYSLDAGKAIQCGEGGLIVTNTQEMYKKVRAIHDHGHSYDNPNRAAEVPICVGFNFRMTELQAAYAIAQLGKLTDILTQQCIKKTIIGEYIHEDRIFNDVYGDAGDSFIIQCNDEEHAARVVAKMKAEGIGTKNIPDSLNWHFSGNWGHVFKNTDCWEKSRSLLYRSIALPITLGMNASSVGMKMLRILNEEK